MIKMMIAWPTLRLIFRAFYPILEPLARGSIQPKREEIMRTRALALMLSVVALFGSASAVRAADATCGDVLSGIIDGNVVVPRGTSCTMSDVTIRGNVQVSDDASLTIDA